MKQKQIPFVLTLSFFFLFALMSVLPVQAAHTSAIIYVDAAATGAATGASWTDAFTSTQDALAHAVASDQIWVAAGIYYPDEGSAQTDGNRNANFSLKNDVALYGGFAGNETQLGQRNPAANITVLSGDIDQNDSTDPNGVVTNTANIVGLNAYHVVSNSGINSSAILDGFTITAGQANGGWPDYAGGGMYNSSSHPAIYNVIFSGNTADNDGGGMFNNDSTPTLDNVTFIGNAAGSGGGMLNLDNSNPALTNVTFVSNSSSGSGGGMFSYDRSSSAATPVLTNVTFSGNTASDNGGGMYNLDQTGIVMNNVTFSGNTASSGGGIYSYGRIGDTVMLTLNNVIIANSTNGDCVANGNFAIVAGSSNNLIESSGGSACGLQNGVDGNIVGYDPNLGALTDYGAAGTLVHTILNGSPAIDAGDAGTCAAADQRGLPRPVGAACDIGAYELGEFSLAISKWVNDAQPAPTQVITFTIVATNTGPAITGGQISDVLPAGMDFLGPITLDDPSGTGTAGTQPPTLVSGLALSANDVVTITFPVTVSGSVSLGTVLTNTAVFNAVEVGTPVTDDAIITVTNLTPVADAGSDQDVHVGDGVTLNGTGSNDPDGDTPIAYLWTQTGGTAVSLNDPTITQPTFTAPSNPAVLTFSLTVTDSWGLASTADSVTISVTNQAPVADAGSDQNLVVEEIVTLDGTGSSDSDGDIPLTYLWVQTGGTAVTLSDTTAAQPTFTAPIDPTILTFTLTVTDSYGVASAPDTVVITVREATLYVYLPVIMR